MTNEVRVWCFTCRVSITPARLARHQRSIGHVRRALGDPPPFVKPKARDAGGLESEDAGRHADELHAEPPANPPGPCVVGGCPNPRQGGTGHARMHCPDHQAFARPEPFSYATARAAAPDPAPCPADGENGQEGPIARAARARREARARHG